LAIGGLVQYKMSLEVSMLGDGKELSLEQVRAFEKGSEGIGCTGEERGENYEWLDGLLCRHEYWKRTREEEGLPRGYSERLTGLSRAQIARLIARYLKEGAVEARSYRGHRFGTPLHARRCGVAGGGGRGT